MSTQLSANVAAIEPAKSAFLSTDLTPSQCMAEVITRFPGRHGLFYEAAAAALTANRLSQIVSLTPAAWKKLFATDPTLSEVRFSVALTASSKAPDYFAEHGRVPLRISNKDARGIMAGIADLIFPNASTLYSPPVVDVIRSTLAGLGIGGRQAKIINAVGSIQNIQKVGDDTNTAQALLLAAKEQNLMLAGETAKATREVEAIRRQSEARFDTMLAAVTGGKRTRRTAGEAADGEMAAAA